MSARWVLLVISLLCMASCSFIASPSSAVLIFPAGAVVFGLLSVIAFISHRVDGASRGDAALMADPETLKLLSARAKAAAARNAPTQAQPQRPNGEGSQPQ